MRIYDLTAVFSADLPIYGKIENRTENKLEDKPEYKQENTSKNISNSTHSGSNGDPGVDITAHCAIARGDSCNLSLLRFGSHTGTHIDVPKHFIDEGVTCDTVDLSQFYGPAKVFDLRPVLQGRPHGCIEKSDLEALDINEGDRVLFNTGNSPLMRQRWFTPDFVSLSPEAAAYLVEKCIKTVGIDYLSVEAHGSKGHKTHLTLLGNGITIIEGLVFDNVPPGFVPQGRYTLSALPLKIQNGDGSPVRAILVDERRFDLAIFDMDGLMLDTEPISVAGWQEAGRQFGHDFPLVLFDRLYGCGVAECKARLTAHFGPEAHFDFETVYAARNDYVRTYIDKHGVAVKPGLHKLLDSLEARGIKKCVATSTKYARAVHLLSRCGIVDRFDAIIAGDTIARGKPDPEIFLTAAQQCGVTPENSVVFEDSATGAEAAYNAGMRTVLVPDLSKPDNRTLGRVSMVCHDLSEAADYVNHCW